MKLRLPRKLKKKLKLLLKNQKEKETGCKVKITLIAVDFKTERYEFYTRTYLTKKYQTNKNK